MIKEKIKNLSALSKINYILILVFLVLNLVFLIIAFQMNIDDLKFLVKMARYIPYMRYLALTNILLFIGIIFLYYLEINQLKKSKTRAEDEAASMKARLYDIEEAGKKKALKSE